MPSSTSLRSSSHFNNRPPWHEQTRVSRVKQVGALCLWLSFNANFGIGKIVSFMSFHVIKHHFMSFQVISCHFMSFHVILFNRRFRYWSDHVISCYICHFICHFIFHVISCHFISFHVISCHFMSIICLPKPSATALLSGRRQK
jgi:hypothetical protein